MIEIKNKAAYFNYFVENEIECGIVLMVVKLNQLEMVLAI